MWRATFSAPVASSAAGTGGRCRNWPGGATAHPAGLASDRLGVAPTARLLLSQMLLRGGDHGRGRQAAEAAFDDSHYGPAALDAGERRVAAALDGRPLIDPAMPDGPRLNLPDWVLPALGARFGAGLAREAAALETEAPLDLRVNLLKTDGRRRSRRSPGSASGGADAAVALGLRLLPAGDGHRGVPPGLIEAGRGQPVDRAAGRCAPGMRVDYCAGAAGKTLAMAATMGNKGRSPPRHLGRMAGGGGDAAQAGRGGQCRTASAGCG